MAVRKGGQAGRQAGKRGAQAGQELRGGTGAGLGPLAAGRAAPACAMPAAPAYACLLKSARTL